MSDNTQLNVGNAGDIIRTVDYNGAKTQVVLQGGIQSTNNTTTTPLSSGATYTGTGDQNEMPDVMVSCTTDNTGTLYFDFSVDGTNWSTFPTSGFKVASGIHEFHTAVKGPRHFRVRLVNDSGAQTYLRLYTYYGQFKQPNAPLNQALGLDADAILVRPTYPWLDIERGLVSGMRVVNKFGRNTAVGTTFVPVCHGGIYRTPQASGATALRIKAGGNANDTAAGSGAQEVTLVGLDQNFNEVTEAVATAGASASSATTNTFTRLYRAYVSKSGTYASQSAGSHAADITIENGAGGTDWATISDDLGFPASQSEIAAYSVPAGHTAYVFRANIFVDSSKTTYALFFHRAGADDTAAPYEAMRLKSVSGPISGVNHITLSGTLIPLGPFVGPCDIGFMAKVNSTTAEVSVEFEIFLVNE